MNVQYRTRIIQKDRAYGLRRADTLRCSYPEQLSRLYQEGPGTVSVLQSAGVEQSPDEPSHRSVAKTLSPGSTYPLRLRNVLLWR